MGIRPIDLQLTVPQANEVGRAQQYADRQSTLQQQQMVGQKQQEIELRQKQVQHSPRSEGGRVTREKEKGEKKNQKGNQRQSQAGRPPEPEEPAPAAGRDKFRGSRLDISV
ncbi:MAG: hypothetical protein N3A57_06335 [Negativicutes bacterium]|nr:hypothetical protein [Negativicutes bacterium]